MTLLSPLSSWSLLKLPTEYQSSFHLLTVVPLRMLACCLTLLTPLSLTAGDIGGESEALTLDLEEAVDKELGVRFIEVDFTGGGAEIS